MGKAQAMKKAQSTLEYVIMLSVIVGAITFAAGSFGSRIQAGRNPLGARAGRAFGLEASLTPIPAVPVDPTVPVIPGANAQVLIPRSVYLLPGELEMLDDAGILQGGRSDYDPPSRTILRIGLTPEQDRVIDDIQRAVNSRYSASG